MKKKQNLLTTAFVIMLLSFSLNSCKKTETEPEKETADSLLAAGTIDPNAITRFSAATSYNQEARNLQFYNRVYKENAVIPQAPSGEFWENYTQYYPGCSTTPYHRGLDTRASEGTPIYSPLNGVVILADDASGNNWGQVAVYDSDKDVTFTVVHLSSSVVKVGISTPTVVLHGQLLGYSGKKVKVGTVQVTPHLHSEFRRGRKTSCPPCPGTTAALIEERNRDTYDPRLVVDLYPTLEILSNINQSAISSSIFTNNSNIESGNRLVMNCAHRYNHITGILRVELSDANGSSKP